MNYMMRGAQVAYDGEEGGGGEAAAAAAAAALAAQNQPWHAGITDATVRGYLETKGLTAKTEREALLDVINSHRQAETFIGAPADQLLRMPKADDPNAVRDFWARLGAPADASGYDLSTVKTADGKELDTSFAEFLRTTAATQHLPAEPVKALAAGYLEFQGKQVEAQAAEAAAKLEASRAAIKTQWGANYEANRVMAAQAVTKLGVDAETFGVIENAIGYEKVLGLFLEIGKRIGEDTFIAGGAPPERIVTVDGAKAELAAKKADPEWSARYLAGGAKEGAEFARLFAMANPELMAAAAA